MIVRCPCLPRALVRGIFALRSKDHAPARTAAVLHPGAGLTPYGAQPQPHSHLALKTIPLRLAGYHAPAPGAPTKWPDSGRPVPAPIPRPATDSRWYAHTAPSALPRSRSAFRGHIRGLFLTSKAVVRLLARIVAAGSCR